MLEVNKAGYVFTSQYLADQKQDLTFADLYHGEVLNVPEDSTLALNIPFDPISRVETPRGILARKYLLNTQHAIAFLGVAVSLVAFAINPNVTTGILALFQIGMYMLFRRLALPAKPRKWGTIYDTATRKPITQAVVRIFDKKFNKLLESSVTGSNGQFGFIVGRNTYYVTVEKSGYQRYVSKDIDLAAGKELVVELNVPLKRAT